MQLNIDLIRKYCNCIYHTTCHTTRQRRESKSSAVNVHIFMPHIFLTSSLSSPSSLTYFFKDPHNITSQTPIQRHAYRPRLHLQVGAHHSDLCHSRVCTTFLGLEI